MLDEAVTVYGPMDDRRRRGVRALGLMWSAIGLMIHPGEAFATHEIDHRFTVEGYVRDAQGAGIPNERVFVRAEGMDTGVTAFTDRSGFYSVLLHLHNKDAGTPIIVASVDDTRFITANFDPDDKATERKTEVNFRRAGVGASNPDGTSDNRASVIWGLVALGAAVSLGCLTWMMIRRRKT